MTTLTTATVKTTSKNIRKYLSGLESKNSLKGNSTFWYISMPSLHNYDVNFPDATF